MFFPKFPKTSPSENFPLYSTLQTNIPLQTSNGQMVTTVHLSIMSLSLLCPTTPGRA